jgi:DnaJ-like protein
MSGSGDGIRVAIELLHVPSRVRIARIEPLPAGMDLLLRIAAGEEEAEGMASASTGRPKELVRQAAIFFIEQVLLCSNSDSYRVLGANSQASNRELRRNMALLIKWLHPDKGPLGQRSLLASRVTRAWDDLKTPKRRASYDEGRHTVSAQKHVGKSRSASNSSQMLVSPRRRQQRVFVMHISDPKSLLSRAWLFLLRVAGQ